MAKQDNIKIKQFKRNIVHRHPNDWMRVQGRLGVLSFLSNWSFVRDGLDSGYHPCCVATFKIRSLLMDLWAWFFNSQWLFNPNNKVIRSWRADQKEEMNEYFNSLEFKLSCPGYVQCYFHKMLTHILRKPYEWHRCSKCNWAQIRSSECNRCK